MTTDERPIGAGRKTSSKVLSVLPAALSAVLAMGLPRRAYLLDRAAKATTRLALTLFGTVGLLQCVVGTPVHAQTQERKLTSPLVEYDIRGRRFRVPEPYLGGWQATKRQQAVINASFLM